MNKYRNIVFTVSICLSKSELEISIVQYREYWNGADCVISVRVLRPSLLSECIKEFEIIDFQTGKNFRINPHFFHSPISHTTSILSLSTYPSMCTANPKCTSSQTNILLIALIETWTFQVLSNASACVHSGTIFTAGAMTFI